MARTTNKAEDLITFSRASTGTALTKVAYGPELVTNGTFDSDTSGWGRNNASGTSTFSVTSGEATFTRDTFGDSFYQTDVAPAVAGIYLLTFDITAISGGGLRYSFSPTSAANPSNQVTASSVGSYSTPFVSDGTLLDFVFDLDANGASVTIDNISVKEVFYNDPTGTLKLISHPIDKPRVEYDANGVAKGLLIEEERTNLVTYSEDFTTSWQVFNSSLTANSDVAPDGTTTADTLLGNATVDTHAVRATITTVTSTQYAASCWFKKQNYSKCGVVILSGTWQHVTYDFDADTLTTYGGATAKREIYGDFVRVTLLFSAGSTTTNLYLGPSSGAAVNMPLAFSADGVELTFWGAQLEAGSFPTSYIPTSGATATRSADIASVSVSEFGYNQVQGSVVVDFEASRALDSNAVLVNPSDGTTSNRMTLWGGTTSGTTLFVVNSGVAQANLAGGIPAAGTHKTAIAYATNDFALTLDAGAIQSDTLGTVPTVSQIDIGRYSNDLPLNGHIKSIKYYPIRLSNTKLQELTS